MKIEVEELYNWLANIENLEEESSFELLEDSEKRNLMYKFFVKDNKIKELCDSLEENIDDENYLNFIKNIILLYPLSKKLIIALNKAQIKVEGKTIPALLRSDKYVKGFYTGLVSELRVLLDETKNNSAIIKLNEELEGVEKEIIKYSQDIEEIRKKENSDNTTKVIERDKLRAEFEKLQRDTDIKKLEEDIQKYQQEIKFFNKEREKKLKTKERLVEQLQKIEKENCIDEEKKLIESLINLWQNDETV